MKFSEVCLLGFLGVMYARLTCWGILQYTIRICFLVEHRAPCDSSSWKMYIGLMCNVYSIKSDSVDHDKEIK